MDDGWIVIPNWDRFQHYKNRDPKWIKDYVSQLHDDDWEGLTMHERGCLQTLRLLYASAAGKLPLYKAFEAMTTQGRSGRSVLVSLCDAGLIEVSASKPLAQRREELREEKKEPVANASKPKPERPEPAGHRENSGAYRTFNPEDFSDLVLYERLTGIKVHE